MVYLYILSCELNKAVIKISVDLDNTKTHSLRFSLTLKMYFYFCKSEKTLKNF